MGRQGENMGADGPEIEMMNFANTIDATNSVDYLGSIESSRNSFQQNMRRFPQNPPGSPEYRAADDNRCYRVKDMQTGKIDGYTGSYNPDGDSRVSDDMQEGAAHVQVIVGVVMKRGCGKQIRYQTDGSDDEHGKALYFLWREESLYGFKGNDDGDHEYGRPINERGKHFRPVPAEGPGIRSGERGKFDCSKRENKRKKVKKHVSCIRQQCKRIGPDASGDLNQQGNGGNSYGIF
jgi:hypothetical protein